MIHQTLTLLFVAVLLAAVSSCQAVPGPQQSRAQNPESLLFDPEPVSVQTGIASYYAGRWIGRKTANGERYHAKDLTAAHRTLPFHTIVRVTNLSNNKSVLVRINNRGPFIKGRIIDLSMEAAREIDMVQAGIRKVKVEVLDPAVPKEEILEYVANQRNGSRTAGG